MKDKTSLPEIRISEAPSPEPLHHPVPVIQRAISPKKHDAWPLDPDQDAGPGHATTSCGPKDDSTVPFNITYTLHITFEGQEVASNYNDVLINPNSLSNYKKIALLAEACVNAQFGDTALADRSLELRKGECAITCKAKDKSICGRDTQRLSTRADWKVLCTALTKISKLSRSQDIHLDVYREYYGLLIETLSDEGYVEAKRWKIFELMESTFDGSKYLSRSDLLRVASKDMVREFITRDTTVQPVDKEKLIQEACERAPKLFTLCVLARIRMSCLKVLLEKGLDDNTDPLEEEHQCHEKCRPDFGLLLWHYKAFNAATFFRIGEHQELRRGTVLPIHYHPEVEDPIFSNDQVTRGAPEKENDSDEENVDSDEYKAFCGSSTYSRVYRVRLDPVHHSLTKVSKTGLSLGISRLVFSWNFQLYPYTGITQACSVFSTCPQPNNPQGLKSCIPII